MDETPMQKWERLRREESSAACAASNAKPKPLRFTNPDTEVSVDLCGELIITQGPHRIKLFAGDRHKFSQWLIDVFGIPSERKP